MRLLLGQPIRKKGGDNNNKLPDDEIHYLKVHQLPTIFCKF